MATTVQDSAHGLAAVTGVGERRQRRALTRGGIVRRALATADAVAVVFAAALAITALPAPLTTDEAIAFVLLVPLWIVAAKLFGLYGGDERRIDHSTLDEVVSVFLLATVASWALAIAAEVSGRLHETGSRLILFWVAAVVTSLLLRGVVRWRLQRHPAYRQRALILGSDATGRLVARKLEQHPEYGVETVGFVDACDGDGVVGTPDDLAGLVRRLDVDRVIVAFADQPAEATVATLQSLSRLDVFVDIVPRLYDVVGLSGQIHAVEGLPLIDLAPARIGRSSRFVKRSIDVVGALAGLFLFAPLFAVVPLLIRRESPGPAFFRQERLGERMRPFTILKFRTMRDGTRPDAHREYIRTTMRSDAAPQSNGLYKLERSDAITRTGAFLRRTSLDELPQLVNVLRGEMSLVGPRPCMQYETEYFQPHHFERFLVPAGLTGLWQVTARAHSTFGEALDMDVAYVRGWSLGLDLSLLLRTVKHVLTRKGTA